jgi:hypothetical protein
MAKTAAELTGIRAAHLRREPSPARNTRIGFYAFDGSACVLIEATSEEDARYLCSDLRYHFIGLCEGKTRS